MKKCTHHKQLHRVSKSRTLSALKLRGHQHPGFVLPMALILGLIMLTLMTASLFKAQSGRSSSQTRQASSLSSITADSAIARILVELSKPNNRELLGRNYDPINPTTGQTYFGEKDTAIDEWTGYDPSALPCYQERGIGAPDLSGLSGVIGTDGTYQLLAYRYEPSTREGKALVQGQYKNSTSYILISMSIEPILDDFPGIGLIQPVDGVNAGILALRGREILGNKSNVYLIPTSAPDPSISGRAAPGDANRAAFLNAIWSTGSDGATTDTVTGSIIACEAKINIPLGITGTNFGLINSSTTLSGVGDDIETSYQLEGIDLAGTETLTIDTTGGPVVIDMIDSGIVHGELITLRDSAKIVNVRTDGQPPRVGDVRIMIRSQQRVALYDQSCIQQVFLYSFYDELRLQTSGPGCLGGNNTNFEGVVWAEAILSSKNAVSNQDVVYLGEDNSYNTAVTPGVTSGIAVPDDVSSLVDLLQNTDIPLSYRYEEVLSWQRVTL